MVGWGLARRWGFLVSPGVGLFHGGLQMEEMLDRQKVAEILGVKQSRIYQLIRCGLLGGVRDPETKRWLVPRSEVDRYLECRVPRGRPKKNKNIVENT